MTEPSSVHVGPSSSMPETTSMTSQGPQLLPSSVKDPFAHPPPPVEPYESFLLRTCRSQPVQGDSVPSVTQSIGALILSTSDGETGPVTTSCPYSDLWCLPWDRPTYQGFVSSTWTQDAAPLASIHPSLSAWQWPGHDVGSSPAQLTPPPEPSAPTTGFPDTVDRPSTVLLPQFQAVVQGTRPSSPPNPVVSARCLLGFRARGDWRHSCIYRWPVSWRLRQWPGPVRTHCWTCNPF